MTRCMQMIFSNVLFPLICFSIMHYMKGKKGFGRKLVIKNMEIFILKLFE